MLATKAVRVNADELGTLFERMASLLQPYLAHRRSKEDAPPDARRRARSRRALMP